MITTARPLVTTDPRGWTALAPGAWTKHLLTAESPDLDGFALIRLAPGAAATLEVSDADRFLVLDGSIELADAGPAAGDQPLVHHPGDYLCPTTGAATLRATGQAAVLLRLTGPALGDPLPDTFGPDGWFSFGPGGWAKPFVPLPADLSDFDERLAGLTWFEPGATSDRHPHPTAHRFLFLAGAADDEMVHPDGRRESAHRLAGDFVDYPAGITHCTHSPNGCLVLFVHETRSPH